MKAARVILAVVLSALLAAPAALRRTTEGGDAGGPTLVVLTPHNEQIRLEIAGAFALWHEHEHGRPVDIDWRTPGGTSEILRQLRAQYRAAVEQDRLPAIGAVEPGVMPYDVLLGGGSYVHNTVKSGVSVTEDKHAPISTPMGFSDRRLHEWFGENRIGSSRLHDPDGHWVATALSSFGILFNRDVHEELGLHPPRTWMDLTDSRYMDELALADPRQSGSIATTYNSILNEHGWDRGWRVLRAISANARTFARSSVQPVLDVSAGEAAAGLCIDFYGRYQAQTLRRGDGPRGRRLGYIEPPGATFIDPDPVSILRGGPNPTLARRFVRFLLTERGQALWQFPAKGESTPAEALGPRRFELRRLPARRAMYERHLDRFIDKVNPYEVASTAEPKQWRGMIAPLMATFAIDTRGPLRRAWKALNNAKQSGAPAERIEAMEKHFYAMPEHPLPDGTRIALNPSNYDRIRADWRNSDRSAELRIIYARFFREQYERVVEMAPRANE